MTRLRVHLGVVELPLIPSQTGMVISKQAAARAIEEKSEASGENLFDGNGVSRMAGTRCVSQVMGLSQS